MKIIILQPYLNLRGGVERVVLKIATHYKAPIYTLEYESGTTFPEFGDLDIRVIGKRAPLSDALPYRASQGFRFGYNFYNMRINEDYDVLNAHISPSEWIRHNNSRVLWYCHTPPREVYDLYATRMKYRSYKEKFVYSAMTKVYRIIAGRVVGKIEGIAANSDTTRDRIKKYFSRDATVINPGVDYEKFSDEGDGKFFLYPSRILANKRQDYVIDAYKKFVRKTGMKNYSLVLAGTLSQDPEHEAYYEKIKKMAKGHNIKIYTNPDDRRLFGMYANASAVMFAAMNEDYGLVPLEAMASSKPVISVNEGGPTETIKDGKTGFLVDTDDEMAEKMRFVAEHPDLAAHMGKEGRRRVVDNYSWGAFFKKFDVMLKKVGRS